MAVNKENESICSIQTISWLKEDIESLEISKEGPNPNPNYSREMRLLN